MKKWFAFVLFCAALCFAQSGTGANASSSNVAASTPTGTNIRTPFFVGAALGFGSGTGVGTDRGLGLRQIEPMIGVWYPGLGYLRFGYGFFDYKEDADDDKYEVEHSDFDVELGIHVFGELFIKGTFARAKELSDLGDVTWTEWGTGFGSMMNIFAKTVLFAEVEYRWILDHYDPFKQKNVDGSRLQFNIGFAAYVF